MSAFEPYSEEALPEGFRYPARLRQIAQTGEYPRSYRWWFVDAGSEAGGLFYRIRQHDGRNLVPFAKVDDDIACFDGDDTSGNPAVLMLILDESGRRYGFADFDDWFSRAEKDAEWTAS